MPSQGSQQLSSSPLCLSLLKFSYATVFNESIAPIPWIHLSSKNSLFAVFETSPVQLDNGRVEERQRFKVLRDPEVMVYRQEDLLTLFCAVLDLHDYRKSWTSTLSQPEHTVQWPKHQTS